MQQPTKQSFEARMNASVEDYVYWHVATIAPLSRLCVRYGNIAAFKPTVTK